MRRKREGVENLRGRGVWRLNHRDHALRQAAGTLVIIEFYEPEASKLRVDPPGVDCDASS
ncbi:MAG: hypothetical protein JNL98_41265 [Bryobacterales bacterium]|nr:hypothetical protein [Bryobacterales bacterium]